MSIKTILGQCKAAYIFSKIFTVRNEVAKVIFLGG